MDLPVGGGEEAQLLDEFAEAIETGGETTTSGRDNLQTLAIIEEIAKSTESDGQPVSIPYLLVRE